MQTREELEEINGPISDALFAHICELISKREELEAQILQAKSQLDMRSKNTRKPTATVGAEEKFSPNKYEIRLKVKKVQKSRRRNS